MTKEEKKMFDALPKKLREGWEVADATIAEESDEVLAVRRRMADFDLLPLEEFARKMNVAKTAEEFTNAASLFDFRTLETAQLAELCFVLGVRTLTGLIGFLLIAAQSDEDIAGVAALCRIRTMLSRINVPQYS